MKTARQVRLLAATLDTHGKPDAPIAVISSRRYLLPEFPPEKRGGPLKCEGHELNLLKRAQRGELQNLDWLTP